MKNRGQISLPLIIGWGVALAIAAFSTITATNVRTDTKLGIISQDVKMSQLEVYQRVSKLEEAITTVKEDNIEIKKDIKSILQLLK